LRGVAGTLGVRLLQGAEELVSDPGLLERIQERTRAEAFRQIAIEVLTNLIAV